MGISTIFKFENRLGIIGTVTFWKLVVFGKIPKLMKTEDSKIDFSGHFLFQIFATDKPLEIDPWNQMQMIPWDLHFCRKKVPSENINPSLRKPHDPIWQSKIQNSPHMFVLVGDVCGSVKIITRDYFPLPTPPASSSSIIQIMQLRFFFVMAWVKKKNFLSHEG